MNSEEDTKIGTNSVVLIGVVSSVAITTELASGDSVSSFDLTTITTDGRLSVPISMPGHFEIPEIEAQVCVVGYVRRRFFRTGSRVESRTEVVATSVSTLRRKAQIRRAIAEVVENLSTLL